MPVVNPEKLVELQQHPDGIRNICILAHVDHGKTSLTDALIATNGIISPKMAGKIRYLDSRPDEQLRGITMESSAISLYFSMSRRSQSDAEAEEKDFLINLIDSPGHIDFSSEVSTASRLSDGALVLVDAVEGVCSQTVTVLRQTWIEHMQPVLVINKVDRLITELKMSPGEAYTHLSRLLEQVNAVVGSFFQGERMEEDLKWRERVDQRVAAVSVNEQDSPERKDDGSSNGTASHDREGPLTDFEEKDDENIYFAPEKNNVIFSSAVDGWAFTVKQFAAIYEKKLGMKRAALEKVLWGDYYLDPKTKRVLGQKHLKGRALKPMFVQLVLDNIWAVYDATVGAGKGKGDSTVIDKMTASLSIKLPLHVLRSKDSRAVLTSLFAAWLPLSTAVLVSVIEQLPSPPAAQRTRLPTIVEASPGAEYVDPLIRKAIVKFETTEEAPVVAYVSKMVAIPQSELPHNKRRGGALSAEEARELGRRKRAEIAKAQALAAGDDVSDGLSGVVDGMRNADLNGREAENLITQEDDQEDPEHLIGFARLYSGTLRVGDEVFVLPPKFNPGNPNATPEPRKTTITALYLLMGRSLEALTSVPAGVIFGVAGLEGHILKSGTLCSQLPGAVNLAGLSLGSQPIVRVALEPANPSDLGKMVRGLKLLEQSDACAVYEALESGEHVILTAGELHLERCLKDLRERFARCEIQAGEPIVPYRESIVDAAEMAPPRRKDLPRGAVEATTTSKQVTMRFRVRPLPNTVTEFLDAHAGAIKRLYSERQAKEVRNLGREGEMTGEDEEAMIETASSFDAEKLSLEEFRSSLTRGFGEVNAEGQEWDGIADKIAAFGPKRIGPNILIDATAKGCCRRFLSEPPETDRGPDDTMELRTAVKGLEAHNLSDKIAYAFQLATAQGPLCHEPVQGVAVFIEEFQVAPPPEEEDSVVENIGRLTGEVIKTVRDCIRQGFLDWSPRLLLAMYSCEIQASTEVLGRVYAVLTRRRGRILSESLKEGTPFFTILSSLPIATSFGFSDEIRKRTSGAASPQLTFAGYEMLDQDPFWVPFTEEDLEDLGEKADKENVAKRFMDGVRQRKGLVVSGKKLVQDAEKQKTLKR
ncbi:MAG: Cytoplasmic GTPase/eEF2-like protein (ribosomal biogenesis) [Caeruleum heppii]|nr:MAG: Cytoplasmic GTPase/eEF2-like protein (ribosomal biogenesis) [Caeruleum heppii]